MLIKTPFWELILPCKIKTFHRLCYGSNSMKGFQARFDIFILTAPTAHQVRGWLFVVKKEHKEV